MTDRNNQDITLQGFVNEIKSIINTARTNAVRSVDFCRVQMKWDKRKTVGGAARRAS